jgi:DNA-directed RNA polymerase-3 subunit RPC5
MDEIQNRQQPPIPVKMEDTNMGGIASEPTVHQPDESDPDPIIASYDVYIKPSMSNGRQIYILQFPNREQPYNKENHSQPLKLRVKPEAGMVELDVPLDAWRNYDRGKGIKWGEAMKKSNMIQGGRTHGLPGGFSIGGGPPAGRGRGRGEAEEEIDQERLLADYAGAIQRDQVLTKQTLGGQTVLNEDTTPQYMIGTFRNGIPPLFFSQIHCC